MIEKIKKLRKLRKNKDASPAFDGYTPETRKEKKQELKDEVMKNVNFIGWFIVYFGVIPVLLHQSGMSYEYVAVVSQIIMFTTLLPYFFVRENNFAWLYVVYLAGLIFTLLIM